MSSNGASTADELIANAMHLGKPGKFILDARKLTDPVCLKRLIKLLSTTSGALQHLVGVLVDEGTLYQKTDKGTLADVLEEGGVLTGTQVNMDSVQFLDGLAELFQKCKEAGAKFILLHVKVDPSEQSPLVIDGYANSLARVATISQDNGLVPIVAPEILVNDCDDIDRFFGVIEPVLATFYKALNDHHVLLEGTLLTPNMVTSGFAALGVTPQVIAEHTLRALKRTVPAAVPAVIFPDGELGEEEPTLILDAIIRHNTMKPWRISSFGIVDANMVMYFAGEEENMEIFRAAFTQWCEAKAKAPVVMPEGFGTIGMPGGGANFGMPGGGGPVSGASHNLRAAEYNYEFKFGFNVHLFFSASAR